MKRLGKALFAVFLAFHLVVILLIPNTTSRLNERWGQVLLPYTNFFAIHTAWSLFSPDPGPALSIAYDIKREGKVLESSEWPGTRKNARDISEYNRKLAFLRFVWRNPYLLRLSVARYLCQEYSQADAIDLRIRRYKIPTPADVEAGQPLNERGEFQVDAEEHALCGRT